MRNLALVCAGLAIVSGIVSANLWRELRTERQLTASLMRQLGESQAVGPALAGSNQSRPLPVAADASPSASVPAGPAEAPRTSDRRASPEAEVARIITSQQEMLKDPEYRKARLAQARMSIPQTYPGLVEELGLTPEEADQLFDLLAENQMEMNDVSMLASTINGVPPDPAAREDANRRRMEMQRQQEEQLVAMLGSSRYAQWQDYQQTRGPRMQAMQLGRTLEGIGAPLTSEQSRSLTTTYVAEQRRMREENLRMVNASRAMGPMDQQRLMEERFKLQAESNRRIVDAARPHMNARQLEALQASLDQQLTMNRASSRMILQQMETQGQNPGQVNSITTVAPASVASF